MPAFDLWTNFGFERNPYSQDTLSASAEGSSLLAGRVDAVQVVQRRIGSEGAYLSVEGPIGAGKTSLLNVAIYRMYEHTLALGAGELWLPAQSIFQPREDADEFEAAVYRVILQTIIRHKDEFWRAGLKVPNLGALDHWLNSPEYASWGGGAGTVQLSRGTEPNTTEAFLRSGFPTAIEQVLHDVFEGGAGGIVCILDNLEIVGQVGVARDRLDELRDRVFNIPNVHWVLCGSRGIVSRARTQRLSGTFSAPLVLPPLTEDEAVEAIELRIGRFGKSDAAPPLSPKAFRFVYRALNRNLRDAMTWAQSFSHWMDDEYSAGAIPDEAERDALLEVWLGEQAQAARNDARGVQPRQWQFFRDLCEAGGRTSSSEYKAFSFAKQQQFTEAVTVLLGANLVVRESDPDDGTKTINAVTANGWLVHFFQNDLELPPSVAN